MVYISIIEEIFVMLFNGSFKGFKRAMSMAEILIALAIIGIIAVMTLPALKDAMPDKEETIHQKMSYIVEQVVAQIYDDDVMYAKKSDLFAQGFQNTERATVNGIDYEGDTKFCELFASKFNRLPGDVVCEDGKKSFTSTDNVDWFLPVTDFHDGSAEIMIDVNGSKGDNCLKGSAGCKNPDRFKYYVKPNGTVTLVQPSDVLNDKFMITVHVTNPEGGEYKIAKLNDNGTTGPFNSGAQYYKDLDRNTKWVIQAYPKKGYYTDWQLNKMRVYIISSDVEVKLVFHERSKYCVILNVTNCDESNLNSCAAYKVESECEYKLGGSNPLYVKNESDGTFQYVGAEEGVYSYECGGPEYTMTRGRPVIADDGTITADTNNNSMYTCGLITGDYQIKVTPQSNYALATGEDDDIYIQDVRLGTDNLTFGVSLRQK